MAQNFHMQRHAHDNRVKMIFRMLLLWFRIHFPCTQIASLFCVCLSRALGNRIVAIVWVDIIWFDSSMATYGAVVQFIERNFILSYPMLSYSIDHFYRILDRYRNIV